MKLVTVNKGGCRESDQILIHTSVKLVTFIRRFSALVFRILIHTSVKLVTSSATTKNIFKKILIHTSVKLVTRGLGISQNILTYFNPHEREARDSRETQPFMELHYFNPHEREARDLSSPLSLLRRRRF